MEKVPALIMHYATETVVTSVCSLLADVREGLKEGIVQTGSSSHLDTCITHLTLPVLFTDGHFLRQGSHYPKEKAAQ